MGLRVFSAGLVLGVLAIGAASAAEPTQVEVPSLDRAGDSFVQMPAHWFRAAVAGPAPAMLLLHGCGGPYADAPPQRLSARMREYAAILNSEGFHVLITDSLSPRGERELCTQRVGARKVTQTQRRRDALGALHWLSNQPEVDARRLGLLGWSNGGSNVLSATNGRHPEVAAANVKASFAAAFYPGCEDDLKRGYQATAPLLMLVGEADDWTPAVPCQTLAARAGAPGTPGVQIETYAGAYHGFDGTAALRLRKDVPNGVNPGQGVHQGGNPAARAASRERLLRFLRETAIPGSRP